MTERTTPINGSNRSIPNETSCQRSDPPKHKAKQPQGRILATEQSTTPEIAGASATIFRSDARSLDSKIGKRIIDLVLTSPPYWQCRDYGNALQIGHEATPEAYINTLVDTIDSWRPLLRSHASVLVNLGDVFRKGTLIGIPALFEAAVRSHGWLLVNRIIWAKDRGRPEPRQNRLAGRHEYVFHLATSRRFYFDLFALTNYLGRTANPGDVWYIPQTPNKSEHPAPFPPELAKRAILMACPERICPNCGKPQTRLVQPVTDWQPTRAQAKRALEIYRNSDLTEEHLAAVRAVGISDTGKGKIQQDGAKRNAADTLRLAREAKAILGGYFREFTFAPKNHIGWKSCECRVESIPGAVLDPFMGSGTTISVAQELGRQAFGADINLLLDQDVDANVE